MRQAVEHQSKYQNWTSYRYNWDEREQDSEESRNAVNTKIDDQDREKAENIRKTAKKG